MSESKHFTLSLSRWHTIAERLSTMADARANKSFGVLSGASTSFALDDEQMELLKTRGEEALRQIELAHKGFEAVGNIRAELARANAEVGVSQLLAKMAGVRRAVRLARNMTDLDMAMRTPLLKVNERIEALQANERSGVGYRSQMQIALVSPQVEEAAKERVAELEMELAQLSDQVNDLNKKTTRIELPVELAREVGL